MDDERIVEAFSVVPREDFLPPGPWKIFLPGTGQYIETVGDDLAYAYQDLLIGLKPADGINNGSPTLHARCLQAASVVPGDRVLHLGCGTGYYSALLAELTGPSGHVVAIDIDAELARQASENLKTHRQVQVLRQSGAEGRLPLSDVIYVNAGVSDPPATWFDALNPGGRLIFPLTPSEGYGGMLRVERRSENRRFAAKFFSPAAFIPFVGAQRQGAQAPLQAAFAAGGWQEVKSLIIDSDTPDDSCWYAGDGWWLSTEAT